MTRLSRRTRSAAIWPTVVFVCLLASAPAHAETSAQPPTKFDDAGAILQAVKARGAESVAAEANSEWPVLHGILKQVATGRTPWLDVALTLRPGASPPMALLLQYAVGEALGHAPENVLRISGDDTFPLLDVCGVPDTDDFRFDTYEKAKDEIDRRKKKVATVSAGLKKPANECLDYLAQADAYLVQFFRVEAPAAQ
jgi:hypothetical protein